MVVLFLCGFVILTRRFMLSCAFIPLFTWGKRAAVIYMPLVHLCVYFIYVTLCLSLPLGVMAWLQLVNVAFSGLFI